MFLMTPHTAYIMERTLKGVSKSHCSCLQVLYKTQELYNWKGPYDCHLYSALALQIRKLRPREAKETHRHHTVSWQQVS